MALFRKMTIGSSTNWVLETLGRQPLSVQLRLLALATAVPLLLLSFVMFSHMVKKEREIIRQGLLTNAKTLAGLVDSEITDHTLIGLTLSQATMVQTGDLAAFWQRAKEAIQLLPGSWIVLSDPQGQMLLNTLLPYGSALPRHAEPHIIVRAFETGRPQVSDLVFGPASKRQTAYVEIPIFSSGKPLYSMSVALAPERFHNIIKTRFSKDVVVGLLDRNHKFVARVPDHETRVGTLGAESWRQAIMRAPEGWTENVSVEGYRLLTSYTQTAHGWIVGIGQRESELARPLNAMLWSMAIVGGLLLLSSMALAVWLSSRAGRSMSMLADAAREVGDGRPVKFTEPSFEEARVIADTLTAASDELKRRGQQLVLINSGLEAQVAERTSALRAELQRREEMETALRQKQKMEAIGRLTGGIAHDFNNTLTIILGNLDTVQRRLRALDAGQSAPLTSPLEAALSGARNAAKLTHRLLAFARQQPLAPTAVDVRALVAGMSDMLTRTVADNVEIETVSGAGLWPVLIDANQLENALLNLVVNARDAMPEGGRITIETSNADLDDAYVAGAGDIKAGQYVMLGVSDTGTGIPADKQDRVFEPFFTTKPPGEGTGLGLAMVHGFVKQSGGHIRLYSEVGHGTTFKIYLPRLIAEAAVVDREETVSEPARRAKSGETILLVEDDPGVREYASGVLIEIGYQVISASDGETALRVVAGPERIDLMFTDVVMASGLNGRQLADQALAVRPSMPVLFTTGYTRNAIMHHGVLDPDVQLLNKPYTRCELANKIRRVLDKRASGVGSSKPHSGGVG